MNVDYGGRPLESLITLVNEHLEEPADLITTEENVTTEETPAKDEL